jgi:hypothetical protein
MKRVIEREINASVELAKEEMPAEWLAEAKNYPHRLFAFRGKVEPDGSVSPLAYFFEYEGEDACHVSHCAHKDVFPYRYGREYL